MAHKLELAADGRAAFADSSGQSAWHRLGTVAAPGENWTASEALEHAFLNGWDVRKAALRAEEALPDAYAPADGDQVVCEYRDGLWVPQAKALHVPDKHATVRTNPFDRSEQDALGVVGNAYTPFQNEQSVELIDAVLDESHGRVETAGSLRGGRETFVTVRLPETMNVGGKDAHSLYLAALNTHDGTKPFRFFVTPVRIVCWNTQQAAIGRAVSSFSIPHRSGGHARIEEARQALGLTWKFLDAFQEEADKMIAAELTDKEFGEIVKSLFPEPKTDSKRSATTYSEKIADLSRCYTSDATNAELYGTRWGGYNAVTRYMDHVAPVVGQKKMADSRAQDMRAERTLTAHAVRKVKEEAFAAFAVN